MKNFIGILAIAGSLLTTSIHAFELGRPLLRAHLSQQSGSALPPTAQTLTLHEDANDSEKVVFALLEDTGIRCVMAPCPSHVTTTFRVSNVEELDAMTKKYTAWEVLTNIPPHVRIAPRRMEVIDFMGFQQQWTVNLTNRLPGSEKQYVGYPTFGESEE